RPGRGHPGGPQPGPPDPVGRRGALAAHAVLGDQHRSRVRPKRAQVIACYTSPPPDMTVVCADELGPVIPRSFPPAPGWTADGHQPGGLPAPPAGPPVGVGPPATVPALPTPRLHLPDLRNAALTVVC